MMPRGDTAGPFRLVTYMERFGPQAYFANFPSKFLSADAATGGVDAYLSYSANYSPGHKPNPAGGGYFYWDGASGQFVAAPSEAGGAQDGA